MTSAHIGFRMGQARRLVMQSYTKRTKREKFGEGYEYPYLPRRIRPITFVPVIPY